MSTFIFYREDFKDPKHYEYLLEVLGISEEERPEISEVCVRPKLEYSSTWG